MCNHPSDSEIQRKIETKLIDAISEEIEVALESEKLDLGDSVSVQIDGYNAERKIACEAFARIGKMNPEQKRKLGNDILKLLLLQEHLNVEMEKFIVVAGLEAYASLTGKSWQAAAIRKFGIKVVRIK